MDAAADTIPTRDVAIEGDTTAFIEKLTGLVRLAAISSCTRASRGPPGHSTGPQG